jgi:hypothetical protein
MPCEKEGRKASTRARGSAVASNRGSCRAAEWHHEMCGGTGVFAISSPLAYCPTCAAEWTSVQPLLDALCESALVANLRLRAASYWAVGIRWPV